ncbi:LOW QUALITY PROTEIN: protein MENT [Vipera latastei]
MPGAPLRPAAPSLPARQRGGSARSGRRSAPPRSSRSFVPARCLARARAQGEAEGRSPMALGLALALTLAGCWLGAAGGAQEPDEEGALVSAPPELLERLPAAAKATVAAGYLNPSEAERAEAAATQEPSAAREAVLIVGDTRYAWQEWSAWHCNCAAGSMARVRDITYASPGVRLDPAQYDLLRFERVVCSYAACGCSRPRRQCDLLAPSCDLGEAHLCALRDIQHDQDEKRRRFWAKVNAGLKALWRSLKEAFPRGKKSKTIQVKSSPLTTCSKDARAEQPRRQQQPVTSPYRSQDTCLNPPLPPLLTKQMSLFARRIEGPLVCGKESCFLAHSISLFPHPPPSDPLNKRIFSLSGKNFPL